MKSKKYSSRLQEGDAVQDKVEHLVHERPLQIIVNNREFSMTMQTPGDERFLIRGLLHAEGINHSRLVEYSQTEGINGTVAAVRVNCDKIIDGNRNLTSTSSCGLCGKKTIENLFDGVTPVTRPGSLNAFKIQTIYKKIAPKQDLFRQTGGCHAASAVDSDGNIICVFEDIGRHNAVDKVIGFLLENDRLPEAELLTVSGRVSFEIIQKCARADIPFLCAISAPSSLAVETAEKWGLTLAAFCRADRATFYSGHHRINQEAAKN